MTELRPTKQYCINTQDGRTLPAQPAAPVETLHGETNHVIMQPAVSVVPIQQLDDLERRLIAALNEIWIAQGKHKKVVNLR